MDAKKKRKQLKLINEAYDNLANAFSVVGWGMYGRQYEKLNKEEEESHRTFKPDHITAGIITRQAVKYFYVHQIAAALTDGYKPALKDYLHTRKSIFFAWALVENYPKEIKKALEGLDLQEIMAIDYAELMAEPEKEGA